MNEIPMWWLAVTGVAAVLIAIFFCVLIFMVMALMKLVAELQKPITELVTQVKDLVPEVKGLVQKVENLTVKVEGIADSTRSTVDVVGVKAKGIATAADQVASFAAQKIQQFAPIFGTVMAGIRMFNALREHRSKGRAKVKVYRKDHLPATIVVSGDGNPSPGTIPLHRGVEQSGSSSGS